MILKTRKFLFIIRLQSRRRFLWRFKTRRFWSIYEHTQFIKFVLLFLFFINLFSFFNYLKFSRFLKISKANFDAEKRQKIRDTIIENEYWIKQLLKKQGEILKSAAEKAKKLEMWKLQSWYDYFFKYNPNLNVWQNNFLQA